MSVNIGLVLLLCCGWSLSHAADTSGAQKNYIVVFLENTSTNGKLQLHFVTNDEPAKVTVTVKNPNFHEAISVRSNSSAMLTLDAQYMIINNEISSKVVMVTSDVDISVFGFNKASYSADATFILPAEDLGTEYFIFTPPGDVHNGKQFAVASGMDRIDRVEVTVSGSLTYNGKSYSKGGTFSFSLAPHQVIQFQSSTDLTGTRVVASAPVAVFTGHRCYTGHNTKCDVLFQQLYPVPNWGTSFIVFPLANHTQDIVDIMSAYADTIVKVDKKEHTLQPGSHIQYTLNRDIFVNSSKPVWVSYLGHDTFDPFLTTVPPLQMRRQHYRFVTDSFDTNYITVVSQAPSASEFFLDQKPLSQYSFFTKEMNGFRIWEVSLGNVSGVHEIFHKSLPFSIYVFGNGHFISYGYSMGLGTKFPASSIITPTEEPEIPPVFNCYAHGAEFQLPLMLVSKAKLNVSDVHLEDAKCKGTQKGKFVVINVPFNKCGSKVLNEKGKTVYVNTVYGTVPETGVHRIEFPLKCEMKNNKTFRWNFHPQVTDVVSLGDYNVSLKLYQDEAFTELITIFPCEVDLHGRLYVEFQVETEGKDLQLFVENCKAVPSLEETEEYYNVIREGCSEDDTLREHSVSDQRFQRFSFHVFKFYNREEVYLSCNTIICHNGTSPNRCTEGCLGRRRRRDVHNSMKQLTSARLSQGPIIFSSERPLWNSQPAYKTLAYVLMAVVGVMGMLTVMGLVILKHHYRRQENSRLKRNST